MVVISSDSYFSSDQFDTDAIMNGKSVESHLNPKSNERLIHKHINYPGKMDSNTIQDVEKCLAFYHNIREYFDDDVVAMLLKCCLCYGDCSGKR